MKRVLFNHVARSLVDEAQETWEREGGRGSSVLHEHRAFLKSNMTQNTIILVVILYQLFYY